MGMTTVMLLVEEAGAFTSPEGHYSTYAIYGAPGRWWRKGKIWWHLSQGWLVRHSGVQIDAQTGQIIWSGDDEDRNLTGEMEPSKS